MVSVLNPWMMTNNFFILPKFYSESFIPQRIVGSPVRIIIPQIDVQSSELRKAVKLNGLQRFTTVIAIEN